MIWTDRKFGVKDSVTLSPICITVCQHYTLKNLSLCSNRWDVERGVPKGRSLCRSFWRCCLRNGYHSWDAFCPRWSTASTVSAASVEDAVYCFDGVLFSILGAIAELLSFDVFMYHSDVSKLHWVFVNTNLASKIWHCLTIIVIPKTKNLEHN